jgi:hypothetical protein
MSIVSKFFVTCMSRAIRRAGCFHYRGHEDPCHASTSPYIAIFGVMQIFFSQIPDLDKVWWLSTVAAIMSFSYSTIGICLGVAQIVGTLFRSVHVVLTRRNKKTQNCYLC